MKKLSRIFLFFAISGIIFGAQELYAAYGDAMFRYDKAVKYLKMRKPDFALMEFRGITREFPDSLFAPKATFAIAEYCYDHRMYYDAVANFCSYIKKYPNSKAGVFARAYLLKIMEDINTPSQEEKAFFEDVNKNFFPKQPFVIFKEYKRPSYKSFSLNRFRLKYHADSIEIYRNGALFLKLTP